jgi:hypothetical protein
MAQIIQKQLVKIDRLRFRASFCLTKRWNVRHAEMMHLVNFDHSSSPLSLNTNQKQIPANWPIFNTCTLLRKLGTYVATNHHAAG